jgi:hypothetical protein
MNINPAFIKKKKLAFSVNYMPFSIFMTLHFEKLPLKFSVLAEFRRN